MFVVVQAEDGIRDLVRSRGLGDVYKRQPCGGHQKQEKMGHAPRAFKCAAAELERAARL